ncbi:MAG TPA: MFS transporter [Steroidobacteraceae bacterium]|nr:MFS transporter [Steroidobacteraceae bacterium]
MVSRILPAGALGVDREHRRVILASSLGTVFEWYDFYLYGSLAALISKVFFAGVNETSAFILTLLIFAAGFAVRPLGALVFGRLGDLVGRKRTFLITIVIMGIGTALVGALPTYATAGILAPLALVCLRIIQGLAIGGEYGGAATYVAEHASPGKRGLYTGWVQSTATLGLLLSLTVILTCRALLGPEFDHWGWRVPFLGSILLLAVSVYIRLQLSESPVFQQIVAEGTRSRAPVRESFGCWGNLRLVLLALFGAIAGMTVIWTAGQLYALYFLSQVLKVNSQAATLLMAATLVVGAPLFVISGAISDRVGRKRVFLLGCALAAATYFPVFHGITHYANPAIQEATDRAPVAVIADVNSCSSQFDPLGRNRFTRSCDVAKAALGQAGVPYATEAGAAGGLALVRIGRPTESPAIVKSFEGERMGPAQFKKSSEGFATALRGALTSAGYPTTADPARINYPMVFLLLLVLVVYVALVYGPLAAWLVELFPARIRYTSISVPYHIGVGWLGGFLPAVAFSLVAITGDIYSGLWYPVVIAAASAVIGALFLPETVRIGAAQIHPGDLQLPNA